MNRTIIACAMSGLWPDNPVIPAPMFVGSMIAWYILKWESARDHA
jgi:hypothetical protein